LRARTAPGRQILQVRINFAEIDRVRSFDHARVSQILIFCSGRRPEEGVHERADQFRFEVSISNMVFSMVHMQNMCNMRRQRQRMQAHARPRCADGTL
jgi:hypothetical protein